MASNGSEPAFDGSKLIFIMDIVVIIPLCLLGLPGNAIAFCIFGKMERQNATTFLMRALAVVDSSVLLVGMTYMMVYSLGNKLCDIYPNDAKCHLLEYSLHIFGQITNINLMACIWTSVIIGMNRYIAVCWPLQATRLCTVSNARKQILGVILGSIVFSLPGFFETKLEKASHGSSYSVKYLLYDNDWYFYTYTVGCDLTFVVLIPFGLCLFFTARLVATLRAAREQPISRHGGRQMDAKVMTMPDHCADSLPGFLYPPYCWPYSSYLLSYWFLCCMEDNDLLQCYFTYFDNTKFISQLFHIFSVS